jgi:hypothetical protein
MPAASCPRFENREAWGSRLVIVFSAGKPGPTPRPLARTPGGDVEDAGGHEVLRLRGWFASQTIHSAQDDRRSLALGKTKLSVHRFRLRNGSNPSPISAPLQDCARTDDGMSEAGYFSGPTRSSESVFAFQARVRARSRFPSAIAALDWSMNCRIWVAVSCSFVLSG